MYAFICGCFHVLEFDCANKGWFMPGHDMTHRLFIIM